MALSKRIRFEIFKRDNFTCQYCGRKAPDIVLHCDHIDPKSKGGNNTILNLITACEGCNLGKGARRLSDNSVLTKQRDQLALLQERQEQISMMMEWQRSLLDSDTEVIDKLAAFWCELATWFGVNESGKKALRKHVRQFGVEEVMTAMRLAAEGYFEYDDDGDATAESSNKGFNKIGGICAVRRQEKETPEIKDLLYIRGILRKRLSYCDPARALDLLQLAHSWGADATYLKRMALTHRTWTDWRDEMNAYTRELQAISEGGE